MRELRSPDWIIAKGVLFLVLGCLSGALLILSYPFVTTVILLVVSIWAFCRFYYFAFYVVDHYIDGPHRFSGLVQAIRHWRRRKG